MLAKPSTACRDHSGRMHAGTVRGNDPLRGDTLGQAAHQVGGGRRTSLVGDVREVDAGSLLEQLAGELVRTAQAARGEGHLARAALAAVITSWTDL
jgi:hypothetical protein